MSIQFGQWNLDGRPIDGGKLDEVRQILARYGPDQEGSFLTKNVVMLYRAFHTTSESHNEIQPHVLKSGAVLTWDGRLDNREHFMTGLSDNLSTNSPDLAIVAAAYERWETGCFGKLIGDWAMSVWNPETHSIILAKDFVGTRHLYYSVTQHHITWSTLLDPLVLLGGHSFELEQEYLAGWLSFFPAPHLTPYRGVRSVPPCSFVRLTNNTHKTCKYWDFDPAKRICYRSDEDYEEHFRTVFGESVRRRLRCDSTILAELSGGIDSSSIVCVADRILAKEGSRSQLDTISYYDDSEPNWNERPYFMRIEQTRGRSGCHISIEGEKHRKLWYNRESVAYTPASTGGASDAHLQFSGCLETRRGRVVLNGIGGDETLGGVPTALPELADLLANGQFRTLAHQLKTWALSARRPWLHLLRDTFGLFCPPPMIGMSPDMRPAPWISKAFAQRYATALSGYRCRIKVFGATPSMQENLFALGGLRRQMACSMLSEKPLYERRYPYLDRDLLDFLFAIPRQQLVRPHQRRSLMRRALRGVVPDEVLNRKRKAFVSRAPVITISEELAELDAQEGDLIISSLGVVDEEQFRAEMLKAKHGGEVAIVPLLRALTLESWLKGLANQRIVVGIPRALQHTRPIQLQADLS